MVWVRLGGAALSIALGDNAGQRCAPQKPDHERGLVSVGAVKQFGLETWLKPDLEEEHLPGDIAA